MYGDSYLPSALQPLFECLTDEEVADAAQRVVEAMAVQSSFCRGPLAAKKASISEDVDVSPLVVYRMSRTFALASITDTSDGLGRLGGITVRHQTSPLLSLSPLSPFHPSSWRSMILLSCH